MVIMQQLQVTNYAASQGRNQAGIPVITNIEWHNWILATTFQFQLTIQRRYRGHSTSFEVARSGNGKGRV